MQVIHIRLRIPFILEDLTGKGDPPWFLNAAATLSRCRAPSPQSLRGTPVWKNCLGGFLIAAFLQATAW
jgi:hypothetical protein